ncbi:phosphonopyruvate decarboxylase [Prodigiosinella aquatilis]|nr:phosphonopyruvate decarboxylase [Prodigiosinella sp. LS101]WJV55337.1 phosphonopyruvate decarboxylase [Prodigiosinella sp. LS101]WJV59699.1 phosphonopyruvate decarboxylase [Pectobacteriaceae bacterium C111]
MKVKGSTLFQVLSQSGCIFYTGVPDSVLAGFIEAIEQAHQDERVQHIVAANEGNAIAMAAGKWLATGEISVVYMQNSGLGNAINPLMSLSHDDVYRIPMLLIIGWRGHNGRDEPQHLPQGRATPTMLEIMDIKTMVLEGGDSIGEVITAALTHCREHNSITAILIPREGLEPLPVPEVSGKSARPYRGEVLEKILKHLPENDIIVSSTGFISREILDLCRKENKSTDGIFMNVGAMGHTSSLALGISLALPGRTVWCIEGDGSFLMHLGAAATIGNLSPHNLKHIVLDNGIHASVGGIRHCASALSLSGLASCFGYARTAEITTLEDLDTVFTTDINQVPELLIIRIAEKPDTLMRPDKTLIEFRDRFIQNLRH